MERLRHHPWDVGPVGHQPIVLGDPHGDAGDVALLEGVGPDRGGGHLAGHHHQGDRVHIGVGQRRDDVGRPGTAGDHGHAGSTGHLGVALGHVAGPLLMAHEDVTDRRVEDGVVDRQDGAAGEAEHDLDPLHLQALDQGLCSCEFHRGLLVGDGRGSGLSYGSWLRLTGPETCWDMKTTSRLGGRKARTAIRRRARYETSTRVLRRDDRLDGMIKTLLHGGVVADKHGSAAGRAPRQPRRGPADRSSGRVGDSSVRPDRRMAGRSGSHESGRSSAGRPSVGRCRSRSGRGRSS